MKTYIVTYSGNSSRFKNLKAEITANSEREAVEKVFNNHLPNNYFPQDDGSIQDCDGYTIARAKDDSIEYDGGRFVAEEVGGETEWKRITNLNCLDMGMIVKNRGTHAVYVVTGNYGGHVTAVKTVDITNPPEWLVLKNK